MYLYCIASEGTFMSSFYLLKVIFKLIIELFIFSKFINGFRIS